MNCKISTYTGGLISCQNFGGATFKHFVCLFFGIIISLKVI